MSKQNERIQVTLPEETIEWLEEEAKRTGLKPNEIARATLNRAAREEDEKEEQIDK